MSPIYSLPIPTTATSTAFNATANQALTTPFPDAANRVPSILEALAENNTAQWLMLGLAIPGGGYALYQIVTCIQQLVGPSHPSMYVGSMLIPHLSA